MSHRHAKTPVPMLHQLAAELVRNRTQFFRLLGAAERISGREFDVGLLQGIIDSEHPSAETISKEDADAAFDRATMANITIPDNVIPIVRSI